MPALPLDLFIKYSSLLSISCQRRSLDKKVGQNSSTLRSISSLCVFVSVGAGYRIITALLYQIASMGYEEKEMLLGLGAVYRLVCSMLSINPSISRIPPQEMQCTVDLIALLVRSALIQSSSGGSSSSSTTSAGAVPTAVPLSPFLTAEARQRVEALGEERGIAKLSSDDRLAFLNK